MSAALHHGCGKTFRLIGLVLALSVTGSEWVGAADGALTGSWFTETQVAGLVKRSILWQITGAGTLTMFVASTESGALSTQQDSWAVRRPDHPGDVAHGKYRLLGSDSLSTRIAGLPPDDIIWKRIPRDGQPARVPGCLLKLIQPGPAANAERPAFPSALTGLWEASYTGLTGLRRETVWRITPDSQSLRLDVEMRPMTYTAGGGQLKIAPPGEGGSAFTYRFSGKDTLETVDGEGGNLRWSRCPGARK